MSKQKFSIDVTEKNEIQALSDVLKEKGFEFKYKVVRDRTTGKLKGTLYLESEMTIQEATDFMIDVYNRYVDIEKGLK